MKNAGFLVLVALLALSFAGTAAQAQDHPKSTSEHPAPADGILAVAGESGDFSIFLAAVKAAGLEGKFNGKGPITVFAPTNAAFAKLPDSTLDDLLAPANKAKLAGVLACHVVPGRIMAADVKTMKATNVSGQDLAIEVADGVVTVDGATVVEADLVASNGVIHAIDTVILPAGVAKSAPDKPKDHPAH